MIRRLAAAGVVLLSAQVGPALAQPSGTEDPFKGVGSGREADAPLVIRENGPEVDVTLYADGKQYSTRLLKEWRPICGSDMSDMTLADFEAMIERAKQARGDVEPVVVPNPAPRGPGLNLVFNAIGFSAAGLTALSTIEAYIESQFGDPITVSINIQYTNLGGGPLGATGSFLVQNTTWTSARLGLINGKDFNDTLQDWLPPGATIPVRYNAGSASVTNENRVALISVANFRSTIGSVGGNAADMVINSAVPWDFDPSNGLPFNTWCFQSVVAHEVAHALGFTSFVDGGGGVTDIQMMDIFRFQRTDGAGDYNPDTLAEFQTTARLVDLNNPNDQHITDLISIEYRMADGNPNQASHFRAQASPIGVMQPAFPNGQTFYPDFYRTSDLAVLDAIGWDHPVLSDVTPPQPNPMTFAGLPAGISTMLVSMLATEAIDAQSPPVQYFFQAVSVGGHSSSWQSTRFYLDPGLTPNTTYWYRVQARDSSPNLNTTAFSSIAGAATFIETPTGITFGNVTSNSIELNATGIFTNLTSPGSGLFFESVTAGGNGGISEWVQVTGDTATGLQANTSYTFRVRARNRDGIVTGWSPTASMTTSGGGAVVGDCDGNGLFEVGTDLPCFVNALLGVDTNPPGGISRSDLNGDGRTDGLDISNFVACAVLGCP